MTGTDPAARSRAFFAARFPEAAARLARLGAFQSAVVAGPDGASDIRLDGRSLYGGDGGGFAAAQVAAYMDKPLRLFMNGPDSAGLVSPICIRLVEALQDHLGIESGGTVARYPDSHATFLVVLGVGLGHHLEALAQRTGARWLIVAEPTIEFFAHSFHAVDWRALVETFERRGGGVHVVTERDPAAMAAAITRLMAANGIAFADGSWLYTHYPLWAFAEARRRLNEAIELAFVNRGFFEDELRMMENAVANFSSRPFALLEARPRLRRAETAVIVGAGPSLDEGIDALRRIRDRVVLFSCGTALRPLLRNAIVPDFHCELENVPEVFDVLSEAAKFGDLARIALVASATVDPRVPSLFGETTFFFRDTVSSTAIFGRNRRYIPATAPTCVNMGLAVAAFMGFARFVLFGTDCGVRPGASRHAAGTIYRDIGIWQAKDRADRPAIEVEGNFGGTVQTDWVYDASRLMLAGAIAHFRFEVMNCSDGALIPGAVPCLPQSLEIATPPVDHAAFRAALSPTLAHLAPGQLLQDVDFAALAACAEAMFASIGAALDELAAGPPDFVAVYERMTSLIDGFGDRYAQTNAIVDGTLKALPRIGMFYGLRVADVARRARLYRVFMDAFRAIVAEMDERTGAMLRALDPHGARRAAGRNFLRQ
jgi:Glycosyltransferase Maf N-terminal domain/6-hydroxymethylpterin diphosphokinase MptE-like